MTIRPSLIAKRAELELRPVSSVFKEIEEEVIKLQSQPKLGEMEWYAITLGKSALVDLLRATNESRGLAMIEEWLVSSSREKDPEIRLLKIRIGATLLGTDFRDTK